jgi:hypothetical protein
MVFVTLAAASLHVRPEVVDGNFSAMTVTALGLDDERQQTNASLSLAISGGHGSSAMAIW